MNEASRIGLLAAVVAFVLALVLVPAARFLAKRCGVVDKPGEPGGRKTQRAPVPLFGGLGVAVAAVLAGVFASLSSDSGVSWGGYGHVLLTGALIFAVGLVDDVFKDRIGPLPKFLAQLAAVAILFHKPWLQVATGQADAAMMLRLLASTLWFLTVVNAVNFVDNMNGLCSGLAAISLLVGLLGLGSADLRTACAAGALGGALLGFLPFNFPHARVYLGDAGSHLAGYFLALLSLHFTVGLKGEEPLVLGVHAYIPAILLLGVPLFDLLFSVVCRWAEGRPLFHGDARHLSHRLVGAGLDPVSAVMLLWGVHLMLTAAAVVTLPMPLGGRVSAFCATLFFLAVLARALVRIEAARIRLREAAAPADAGGAREPREPREEDERPPLRIVEGAPNRRRDAEGD